MVPGLVGVLRVGARGVGWCLMVGLPYGTVCGRISDFGFDKLLVEVEW